MCSLVPTRRRLTADLELKRTRGIRLFNYIDMQIRQISVIHVSHTIKLCRYNVRLPHVALVREGMRNDRAVYIAAESVDGSNCHNQNCCNCTTLADDCQSEKQFCVNILGMCKPHLRTTMCYTLTVMMATINYPPATTSSSSTLHSVSHNPPPSISTKTLPPPPPPFSPPPLHIMANAQPRPP